MSGVPICQGGYVCVNLGGHHGPVRRVMVHGVSGGSIPMNYCDTAIQEDRRRGYVVEEIGEPVNPNDTTPADHADKPNEAGGMDLGQFDGHTPGPWFFEPGDAGDPSVGLGPINPSICSQPYGDSDDEAATICVLYEPLYSIDPKDITDEWDEGIRYHGSLEANANLIHKAPALLAEVHRHRRRVAELEAGKGGE